MYKSIDGLINKVKQLLGTTNLKSYQNISNVFGEVNVTTQSGTFRF